jgi:hypothetical protein
VTRRKKRSTFGDYPPQTTAPPQLHWLLPDPLPKRYMVMHLRFDRESFDALKELLREKSLSINLRGIDQPGVRLGREALKRVFDQIRDVEYDDRV